MKKSERENLASMISEMKTSFDSTPEVINWSKRILTVFPCVSKLVEEYDGVQTIENIAGAYASYIAKMSCSDLMLSESDEFTCNLGSSGRDDLYHVFDDYFCHDSAVDMYELEKGLGGTVSEARPMIKALLSDSVFIEAINDSEDFSDKQKELFKGQLLNRDWI